MINIKCKRLDHGADMPLPFYATSGSAGADIAAALSEAQVLEPGQRLLIPSGFCFDIPSGYEVQIRSRSGLSFKHGVIVLNSPGTIDADYQGEVKVLLYNSSNTPFTITPGMRVAQMVVSPVVQADLSEVQAFDSKTARNDGGFGSTGLSS